MVSRGNPQLIPSSADLSKEPRRVTLTTASAAWYSAISSSVPSGPTKFTCEAIPSLEGPTAQSSFVVGVSDVSRTDEPHLESFCSAALQAGGGVNQQLEPLDGRDAADGHNPEAGSIAKGGHEPIGVDAMANSRAAWRSGLDSYWNRQ